MSDQNIKISAPTPLPRISSLCLIVLYFIVLPWAMIGPFVILENTNVELCQAKEQPAESISAQELAVDRRPKGTHVSISNYSMSVSTTMIGKKWQLSTGAEVKPEPPIPIGIASVQIYATLSRQTAANVVNSGELSIGRIKPLISHTVPLPHLDAIVVSSDDQDVRVADTVGLMTYTEIMIRRVLAGLVVILGIAALIAIIMLHRHRWRTAKNG